jgi:ADP-ribose pyrophosphatase YjhB (NUDIX family)
MTESKKDSHCSYCGTKFTEQNSWPRKCFLCYNDSYKNPLPVVVTLLNVWEGNKLGTLIQKRGHEPKQGEWAFTGGYIDQNETWQEAIVREVREELGLETSVEDYLLSDVLSNTDKSNLLVFSICLKTFEKDELNFIPNAEVTEIKIIHEPIELAFPSHTEMLALRFEKK